MRNFQELKASLKSTIKGLQFSSEGSYPFRLFELNDEEPTLFKLLIQEQFLAPLTPEELLEEIASLRGAIYQEEDWHIDEQEPPSIPKRVVKSQYELILTHLTELSNHCRIFRFTISTEDKRQPEYEFFHVLAAQLKQREWIAFAPVHCDQMTAAGHALRSPEIEVDKFESQVRRNLAIQKQLERFLSDKPFLLRQYYEFYWVKHWRTSLGPSLEEAAVHLLGELNYLKICEFQKFSKYHTDDEDILDEADADDEDVTDETIKKFEKLDHFLEDNLSDLKEISIGGLAIYRLYAFGSRPDDSWLGVSTTAIYT